MRSGRGCWEGKRKPGSLGSGGTSKHPDGLTWNGFGLVGSSDVR